MNIIKGKAKISYPCDWEYRVIGPDEEAMRQAIIKILSDKEHKLSFSNISKAGKYISLTLKTKVFSEKERNNIYVSLRDNPVIKIVI